MTHFMGQKEAHYTIVLICHPPPHPTQWNGGGERLLRQAIDIACLLMNNMDSHTVIAKKKNKKNKPFYLPR